MAGCLDYNCDDAIGTHTPNDCGVERVGGANAILLIECGSTVSDPTSGTEINALLDAGNAILIEGDSAVPCQPSRVVNYDRTLVILDQNVNAANVTLYDKIYGGRRFSGAIIWECGNEEDQKVKFINSVITFTGSDRLPNSNSEFQDFEGTGKWKAKTMPAIFNAPTSVLS